MRPKLAGSLFAECWGVGCLRVGSKWCMPSNTPLSSSNSFEGRLTELPAQEEFKNSCRDCICALLFSKAKDGKDLSGHPPSPREAAHLSAFCLCCNAARAGGRRVLPFPAGNKSLVGKFCWFSALLLPFTKEAISIFLPTRSVSANAGELPTRGGPLPAHPRGRRAAWLHAEAPSGVLSPRTGSQGLTHCTVQPSQHLLVSRCSEPANTRGTCPLLRFWNESATPSPC